jgi:NADP-dependent 3-hydroxy acid dehydrogenase YdfG
MNPFDLTGTIALVTGSSRGIGAALAAGLAQAGPWSAEQPGRRGAGGRT